jgi:hypothetical protein
MCGVEDIKKMGAMTITALYTQRSSVPVNPHANAIEARDSHANPANPISSPSQSDGGAIT